RTDIEDDQARYVSPDDANNWQGATALPAALVWALVNKGKETVCYGGQYFFDTDHPVYEKNDGTVANIADVHHHHRHGQGV
ncbi:Mu-like prophage major head subunit gpT family protein, partial [Kingella kingae]|uniref:Mu-like prophage major head subunit gpT family protein n=1 Tax=Kingella kingae TaxID=504 RepID=UPI001E42674A